MPAPSNPIRALAEEFTLAEIERVGRDKIDPAAIAKIFVARGASRASVYRWVAEIVAGAAAPPTPATQPPPAVTALPGSEVQTPPKSPRGAAEGTTGVFEKLPTSATIVALERPGEGALAIMDQLRCLIDSCKKVLMASQTADERVRNPRLMLQAVDHLRRVMETAARVSESMSNVVKVERFMAAMVDQLRLEDPEMATRVVYRLMDLFDRWEG